VHTGSLWRRSLRDIAQSALLMWAHLAPPTRAAVSAAYATLNALVDRHPAGRCIHANLDMVLEMAALKKPIRRAVVQAAPSRHPLRCGPMPSAADN
jgi:hypothetical protein